MENLECLGCRNKLKLWVIERKDKHSGGYDTYENAVVAAENEEIARNIHPNCYQFLDDADYDSATWTHYGNVKATLIGIAASDIKRGVILSSFHEG